MKKLNPLLIGVLLIHLAGAAAAQGVMPGERYPGTRTRTMTRSEAQKLSPAQRRYAINEMFARHGLLFGDMALRKQFLGFDWYQPVLGRTQAGAKAKFNAFEKANLDLLAGVRDGKRPSAAKVRPATFPGERYPQTRTRRMTIDDAAALSDAQLRYAINELYARHGLVFGDLAIRKQFLQFAWYRPVPGRTMQNIVARLSRTEKANLDLMAREKAERAEM